MFFVMLLSAQLYGRLSFSSLAGLRGCQWSSASAGEDLVLLSRSVVVPGMESPGHAWPRPSLCLFAPVCRAASSGSHQLAVSPLKSTEL